MRGKLERCPECGGRWPQGPDHALRGCGWLSGLDREVSPSNNELLIHDGVHGRDRFLQMEIKSRREPWPLREGQLWTLKALSRQPGWTVLILRGDTASLAVHRVLEGGLADAIHTHAEAVRQAINSWLRGSLWRDAEDTLRANPVDLTAEAPGHVHGWARVEGIWTCVQDYYAKGYQPKTACGATLPELA